MKKVPEESKVSLVPLANVDPRAKMASMVPRVSKARRVFLELLVLLVMLALVDPRVQLESAWLALLVLLESVVSLVCKVLQAVGAPLVPMVLSVPLARLVLMVRMARMVLTEWPALMARPGLMERRDPKETAASLSSKSTSML